MAWIMIVDDDVSVCYLLKDILEQAGHKVTDYSNGDRALEFLKNKDNPVPDLMVVDVMMPELDGYTLSAVLQADRRLKNVPIVVVTAMKRLRPFFEPTRKVAAFFEKPIDMKLFKKTVADLLAQRVSGSAPPSPPDPKS